MCIAPHCEMLASEAFKYGSHSCYTANSSPYPPLPRSVHQINTHKRHERCIDELTGNRAYVKRTIDADTRTMFTEQLKCSDGQSTQMQRQQPSHFSILLIYRPQEDKKLSWPSQQRTLYPYKWLPVSCRSGAGQGKFAGQRPTFYTTELHH